MKEYLFALSLLSTPTFGQALDEPMDFEPLPTSAQEIYEYQTQRFADLLAELKTHEYFAGSVVNLQFRGQVYAVDRRTETPKRTPGNPPPRMESLGSLLGNLSASTRGELKINVNREYNDNGTIKSENWNIQIGGSWETSTGITEAGGKNRR